MIYDYHYDVAMDIETSNDCDDSCDPICRCGTIYHAEIKHVITKRIVEHFADKSDPIERHVIERIASLAKKEDFKIEIYDGYYGQEVRGVYCNSLDQDISAIKSMSSDSEKIEYWLTKEYGYVFKSIKNKQWFFLAGVPITEVHTDMDTSFIKLNQEKIEQYVNQIKIDNYKPVLLCEVDSKYKLLDGKHRLVAAKQSHKKTVDIVFCSKESTS